MLPLAIARHSSLDVRIKTENAASDDALSDIDQYARAKLNVRSACLMRPEPKYACDKKWCLDQSFIEPSRFRGRGRMR